MLAPYDLDSKTEQLQKKELEFQKCYDELMSMDTDSPQWEAKVKQYRQLYAETTLLENEIERTVHTKPHLLPGSDPDSIYHLPNIK